MRLTCVGVLLSAGLAFADQGGAKPSFAGTWVFESQPKGVEDASAARGHGGFYCAAECTIVQTDQALTVQRKVGNAIQSDTFRLDGSDSRNTIAGRQGRIEVVSKASWDGRRIRVSTTREFEGAPPVTTTQTISLVESRLQVEVVPEVGADPVRVAYKKVAR